MSISRRGFLTGAAAAASCAALPSLPATVPIPVATPAQVAVTITADTRPAVLTLEMVKKAVEHLKRNAVPADPSGQYHFVACNAQQAEDARRLYPHGVRVLRAVRA